MLVLALLVAVSSRGLDAQSARVRDLTIVDGDAPVRLVGYGLVVGLEGTGDRVMGGLLGGMTVRSVANLLRNLGVEVPDQMIRTRNAAAVLVTAEASPFTRRGGRFDVNVASLGDATSLRGGQLWQTPLLATVGGSPVGLAQGTLAIGGPVRTRGDGAIETSATLDDAGTALVDFASGEAPVPSRLLLRDPDLFAAQRIVEAVNASVGEGVAVLVDAGAIGLSLPPDDPMGTLVALSDVQVSLGSAARIVIDARSGAVAAGGELGVGPAVVSHDWLTLTVGAPAGVEPTPDPAPGAIRADAGVLVQDLAEALHSVGATSDMIASVFRSLQGVGALHAEIVVR